MFEKKEEYDAKGNPLWNVMKAEWNHLGRRRKIFIVYMTLFFIAGLISLTTPLVIGLIFNSIQESITTEADLRKLLWMISLLIVIRVAFWCFHGVARVLEQNTGFHVHKNYTNRKIRKVLELPVSWHKDHHSGDTIDKIKRGGDAIGNFSQDTTFEVLYVFLNIFGSLIILFFVEWKIALVAFIYSLTTLLIVMKVDKKLRKYYKELNIYSNKVAASIFDYISNILTVVTLRLKKTVSEEVNFKLMASYPTHKKAALLNEIKWGLSSSGVMVMTALVLMYKSYTDYYTTGVIMIGTLYILFGYLKNVGESFFKLASIYGKATRYDARISGAYPIDEEFEKIKESVSGKLPPNWEEIELKRMNFTYDVDGKEKHIKDVNIKFHRGQKIALIGESGSGKSTVLSLMRGLYSPEKEYVYVDGVKINKGIDKLKKEITLIPQDPEIFNNTLRFNITMDLHYGKEEIEKAIEMAQFKKVVERLEKGLDTNVLEKGVSLSGGEKQRLALARGLLAANKSSIILLDEPTSSVDSLNEIKIHDNIFKEFKNKTIISSIHRLHLLEKFDYIYMFEGGNLIAEGSFLEMKKNPRFKLIWNKYMVEKDK